MHSIQIPEKYFITKKFDLYNVNLTIYEMFCWPRGLKLKTSDIAINKKIESILFLKGIKEQLYETVEIPEDLANVLMEILHV